MSFHLLLATSFEINLFPTIRARFEDIYEGLKLMTEYACKIYNIISSNRPGCKRIFIF